MRYLSKLYKYVVFYGLVTFVLTAMIDTADAQAESAAPGPEVKKQAGVIARQCLDNWQKQACLKAVSRSAWMLAGKYGTRLKKAGHADAVSKIRNKCAAATAATQKTVPANAMRSAFAECANAILEISRTTDLKPDRSHYQLLVGPVLCIKGDRRCSAIERGLRRYR